MAPYTQVGKYILKRKIGEGAFAEVRLAVHQDTKEEFAVKIFDRDALPKSHFERDIKKEIKIMQRLRHPNIVSIHSVLVTEHNLYLVMELVRGGELYDEIVSKRRVDERTSRRYFQQIVDAMVYCHKQGVVHRDLKPENLLLDGNGNVKITDFGMSWMKDSIDPALKAKQLLQTQCGTPKYMAPEVIRPPPGGYDGEKLDAWECGMVLYALLAGYLPFAGEDDNAVFRCILNGKVKFPPHLSPGAKEVLSLLLEKDPEIRSSLVDIRTHFWFLVDYDENAVRKLEKQEEQRNRDDDLEHSDSKERARASADDTRASKENCDPDQNFGACNSLLVPTPTADTSAETQKNANARTHPHKAGAFGSNIAPIPDSTRAPQQSSPLAENVFTASQHSGKVPTPRGTQRRSHPGASALLLKNRKSMASSSPRVSAHKASPHCSLNEEGSRDSLGDRKKHILPNRRPGAIQGSPGSSAGGLADMILRSPRTRKSPGLAQLKEELHDGKRPAKKVPPLTKKLSSIGKLANLGKSSSATKEDEMDGPLSFRDRIRSPLANMFKSARSAAPQEQSDDVVVKENCTWFEKSPVSVSDQAKQVAVSYATDKRSRFTRDSQSSSEDEEIIAGADDYAESMVEPSTPTSSLKRFVGMLSRRT